MARCLISCLLAVASGCYASHEALEGSSCLPPCMVRLFAGCPAPVGTCDAYITAAPDQWRFCYANGLVIEAQPGGAHRYRRDGAVCASYESVGAATVITDTWRDAAGAEAAVVTRAYVDGAPWRIECDGEEHVLDPSSPECADDPWVRSQNPHALGCEIGPGSDACRTR